MANKKEEIKTSKRASKDTKEATPETNEQVNRNEKSTEQPELSQEQIEFARINMRKEFNKRFSKWAEISQEDATDDDIKAAQKVLDDEVEVHKHEVYKIAEATDGLALKTAEFLRDWNRDFNTWEKGAWKGLVKFNQVIDGLIEELKADDTKNFCIDYATLIFLYNTMMSPSGTGVESALKMAKYENYDVENDKPYEDTDTPITYSGILEKIVEHVKYLSAVDKKLNILKQCVQLAYAGLKVNVKVDSLEEFIEFNDAITNENMPTDDEIADAAKS